MKDAERKGKTCFIEKTPKHIHAVFRIRKILPDAKFIILMRNPIDNCASLDKRFKDLDYAVERWNIDNREILKISRLPRVLIMKSEEISIDPGPAFERMCGFLGLPWIPDILEAGPTGYDREVFSDENMLLRREQVRRAVTANVGKGKDGLSESQYRTVIKKTKTMAEKLG